MAPFATRVAFIFVLGVSLDGQRHHDKAEGVMPEPFTRVLCSGMSGNDVSIVQGTIMRSPYVHVNGFTEGVYCNKTVAAVSEFQSGNSLKVDGVFGPDTAKMLLSLHTDDEYVHKYGVKDTLPDGFLYLVNINIHKNRNIEVNATLLAGTPLRKAMEFRVRLHGKSFAPNQFTSDGDTPTGLATIDLNSPEPDSKDYGPYPINRVVQGLEGNFRILVPQIRNGILIHTGEWPGWNPSKDMPNSNGCIHGHPKDIKAVWNFLVNIGVKVRNNTFGRLPYPYSPQGLLSVQGIP